MAISLRSNYVGADEGSTTPMSSFKEATEEKLRGNTHIKRPMTFRTSHNVCVFFFFFSNLTESLNDPQAKQVVAERRGTKMIGAMLQCSKATGLLTCAVSTHGFRLKINNRLFQKETTSSVASKRPITLDNSARQYRGFHRRNWERRSLGQACEWREAAQERPDSQVQSQPEGGGRGVEWG